MQAFRPRSPRRAGFTLIELMVVIAIIIILVVALTFAVNSATKKAKVADTVSLLTNIRAAITAFDSAEGAYPGGRLYSEPTNDVEMLFDELYYGPEVYQRETYNKPGIGCGQGPLMGNLDKRYIRVKGSEDDVTRADLDDPSKPLIIVDGWRHPIAYIEYRGKDQQARQKKVSIESPDGSTYSHEAVNRDSFDLISSGPDEKFGTKDDIVK